MPTPDHNPSAIVLLSGGLDSATCLGIARDQGFDVHAVSFRYGQRHAAELHAARDLAARAHAASHRVIDLHADAFAGSALTTGPDVPVDRSDAEMASDIPVTYVPARNLVFLSYAVALAESLGSRDIFIGVNALDYSGYPDCRPAFIEAFARTANLATKVGVESRDTTPALTIHTPLISLTKAQIVARGAELGVDYALTVSCYRATDSGLACGRCDACILRRKGFTEAGLPDPTRYADQPSHAR